MSFLLRALPRVACQTSTLCKLLSQPIVFRTFQTAPVMSITGLSKFDQRGIEIKRRELEKDPSKKVEQLREKLKEASKLEKDELMSVVKDFTIQLQTEEDLKLAIELLKNQAVDNLDANISVANLFKRSYELNKRELFIEAFDKYPIFRNNNGFGVVSSYYLDNKELDKVVSLFESYLPRYSDPNYLKKEQKIPFKHLQAMTTTLLTQNTSEALGKLKALLEQARSLKSELGFNSKGHSIALGLLQNDTQFSEECLGKFRINSFNMSLDANFQIIINSRNKRVLEAFDNVEFLFKGQIYDNQSNLKGRIFPYALNELKKAVEESKDKDLLEKFNTYKSQFESQKRITDIDMRDYLLRNRLRPNTMSISGQDKRQLDGSRDGPNRLNRRPQNFGRMYSKDNRNESRRDFTL